MGASVMHVKHAQRVAYALHVTQTRMWSGLVREASSARVERLVFHARNENFYSLFLNFATLVLYVIYQQGNVFHQISKHIEVDWKKEEQPNFFNQILTLSVSGETLFRMFDVAS